jgi:hypothetical protein
VPPEHPPGTDLIVIPAIGERVDLNDAPSVARAYRSVLDLEGMLREAKGTLADALVAASSRMGTKTLHLEGLRAPVVVKGGYDTTYDAQAIKRELLAAGCPAERVAEIVVETIDYRVAAVEAKKAAAANPAYAEIIERNKKVYPKRPSVSVP